ncbi:MAG TPA: hypothetical protein VGQ42_00700 [Candidatus Dormibacteraeota bacterium]|jgi:hypothetical protein|nr:hypothetical protein [Candidatus Dormibacteraeota bacterium]
MIRMLSTLRRRRGHAGAAEAVHLDEAAIASLLRGEAVSGAPGGAAAGHLAACAACRRRLETADPLVSLFEDAHVAGRRVPSIAMPARGGRVVPRPRWQVPAGLALAATVAVALMVTHQQPGGGTPSVQAQAVADVQRVTAMIRTAVRKHDPVGLRQALVEAQKQLAGIDSAHTADPQLIAELASLSREVALLPHDPADAGLITGLESLIADAPRSTASPSPSSDGATTAATPAAAESAPAGAGAASSQPPAAAPTAEPAQDGAATPAPASPDATPPPNGTPSPDPMPSPDATPAPDATPTPDATPSPADSAASTSDRTPPY